MQWPDDGRYYAATYDVVGKEEYVAYSGKDFGGLRNRVKFADGAMRLWSTAKAEYVKVDYKAQISRPK